MNRTAVKLMLVRHEGLKLKAYQDTVGKTTIGVGRNLDDHGISEDEARLLLDNDITSVWKELTHKVPFFGSLDDDRQHALMDMSFNLGVHGLLQFKKMMGALERRDFVAASVEMLDSKWAKQVGERAVELAAMVRGEAK